MGWLVQATDYRKWNEPPRPRLQRNGTIYLMAQRPLLCQGVSRAVLLASSITERKSAARKQRTYRPTSLKGEYTRTRSSLIGTLNSKVVHYRFLYLFVPVPFGASIDTKKFRSAEGKLRPLLAA